MSFLALSCIIWSHVWDFAKFLKGVCACFRTVEGVAQGLGGQSSCFHSESLRLKELVQILNPKKEEGRLMLITRYGAGKAEAMLPGHIQAVKESGIPVTWQCDAVHGNGIVAKSNKLKTRLMNDILAEACEVMAIHKKCGSILGGIHMEVSGQSVTEVVGGSAGLTEEMLTKNYETYCDPRMNYSQAIEAAFRVANEMPSQERAAKRAKVA